MQKFSTFQPEEWNRPFNDVAHKLEDVPEVFEKEGLPPYSLEINGEVFIRTETTASKHSGDVTGPRIVHWLYASIDGVRFVWVSQEGEVIPE